MRKAFRRLAVGLLVVAALTGCGGSGSTTSAPPASTTAPTGAVPTANGVPLQPSVLPTTLPPTSPTAKPKLLATLPTGLERFEPESPPDPDSLPGAGSATARTLSPARLSKSIPRCPAQ
jgi:predicted small lipoprotein YifL